MKIKCDCGALIIDQTDYLPNKGYLIPDQEWFVTFDAIDDDVIDPVADGKLSKKDAYWRARQIIGRATRLAYQCRACGRLFVDDQQGELQCYLPQSADTSREILRGRDRATEPAETWAVYRQDDNGHQFVVQTGLSRPDAERLVEQFTARGHKQTYTAAPERKG